MKRSDEEPRYVISIAASMLGVRTHTLRYYEKIGIIEPSRTRGNIRLYSDENIAYLRRVKTLMEDLGINLAGIEVILRMVERMTEMQQCIEGLETKIKQLNQKQV